MRSFKLHSLQILASFFAIISAAAFFHEKYEITVIAAALGFVAYVESAQFLPEGYFEDKEDIKND